MIKLTNILNESNVKDDFIKALSGEKPAEVYRVHAKLKDGRIGISAWYTKAVIKDIVKDAKATGAKIIKIEKQSGDISINEKWSQKYKRSIDCSNPKGFSQRAHCQGRKK